MNDAPVPTESTVHKPWCLKGSEGHWARVTKGTTNNYKETQTDYKDMQNDHKETI